MSVVFVLLIVGVLVAAGFLAAFVWAVRSGQFEDTTTPAMRILGEEDTPPIAGRASEESKEQA